MMLSPADLGVRWFWSSQKPWLFRSWRRFSVALLILLLVPALALFLYVSQSVKSRLHEQAAGEANLFALMVRKQVAEEFTGQKRYVESFASRPGLVSALTGEQPVAEVSQHLAAMIDGNEKLSRGIFAAPDGTLLYAHPNDPEVLGRQFSSREWFQHALAAERAYVSGVYQRAAFEQEEVIMIAARVQGPDGNLLGVLGGQYLVADFREWINRVIDTGDYEVVVADQHGETICDREDLLSILKEKEFEAVWEGEDHRSLKLMPLPARKIRYLFTTEMVPELNWKIYAMVPFDNALGPLHEVQRILLLFFGLFLLLFLVVGFFWVSTTFRYARSMEQATRQIEYICYSIAHNLRSPLRGMQGFAWLLLDEKRAQLDAEGKEHLQKISKAAHNLDEMIQDLLIYGGTSHLKVKPVRVELASVLDESLGALQDELAEWKAEIRVQADPLPPVMADRGLLGLALKELICNAATFVPPGQQPRIQIRAESHFRCVRIWVEDNGIGIDPKYHRQIFGVFVQLEPGDNRGTGIGLAIAKNAVERMEGSIGVKSAPGKGSAFWIALPRA